MPKRLSTLLGLLVCCVIGCRDSRMATVSGLVTYQGKPLTQGAVQKIVFLHPSGPYGGAAIGPDGRYTLKAMIGPNQISIQCREPDYNLDDPSRAPGNRAGFTMIGKSLIPAIYADHQHSGLTFEVKAGENTANFDLK